MKRSANTADARGLETIEMESVNVMQLIKMLLLSLFIAMTITMVIFLPICILLSLFIDIDIINMSVLMGLGAGIYSFVGSLWNNFVTQR